MNFYTEITQDFFFMLDLCRHPYEVFPETSKEYELAYKWLDKLCSMECMSLTERRWRNIYMSYLLVSLNDRRMMEPFNQYPPQGKLQQYEFRTESAAEGVSSHMPEETKLPSKPSPILTSLIETRNTAAYQTLPHIMAPQTIMVSSSSQTSWQTTHSTPQEDTREESLAVNRYVGDFTHCGRQKRSQFDACDEQRDDSTSPSNENHTVAGQKALLPPCDLTAEPTSEWQCECSCLLQQDKVVDLASSLEVTNKTQHSSSYPDELLSNCSSLYDDMAELLNAIKAELRGEKLAGANSYLEKELVRYKDFVKNFSNMAVVFEKTHSECTLRSFLLLNLQNDLVKLLSERKIC